MDVLDVEIKLHPLAQVYLFKYYAILRRIFSNVLGQLETEYLSIGLIDKWGKLLFLSSKPSLEQNLIEKNLLKFDACFQASFVYQDKPKTWINSYNSGQQNLLYEYKQSVPDLKAGVLIPSDFGEYRVIFSFGFKSFHPPIQNEYEKLLSLGKFCLREIIKAIPLPNQQEILKPKPRLELIINNSEIWKKS